MGGVRDQLYTLIWKSKIPLKVKLFLWQLFHDKLQAAFSLKKKGWQGSPLCCVCGKPETVNHIFFECTFSQYLWCCIRDAFGWKDFQFQNLTLCTNGCQGGWGSLRDLFFFSLQV